MCAAANSETGPTVPDGGDVTGDDNRQNTSVASESPSQEPGAQASPVIHVSGGPPETAFWELKPPPYTVDPPPDYDVPSFPYKSPVPVVLQAAGSIRDTAQFPEVGPQSERRCHYVQVPRPNSHMSLALCTCFLCNFILGGIAIWFSYRSQATDDYPTAQNHSRISLILSLIGVFSGFMVYFIVLMVAVA